MQDEPVRRRRRVRHGPAEPGPEPAAPAARPPAEAQPGRAPAANTGPGLGRAAHRRGDDAEPVEVTVTDAVGERGLRGLIGGGSSQVSPAAAMRARDAARPDPDDLARVETELVIVRRHWTPPTPAP